MQNLFLLCLKIPFAKLSFSQLFATIRCSSWMQIYFSANSCTLWIKSLGWYRGAISFHKTFVIFALVGLVTIKNDLKLKFNQCQCHLH